MKEHLKKIFISLGILMAAVTAISTLSVKAQTSTNNLTGSCGIVFNLTNPINAIYEYKNNSLDLESLNALGHLNFDTLKASFTVTTLSISGSNSNLIQQNFSNASMTLEDSTAIPGAKKITVQDASSNNTIIFNLLPVNSNNTFLIQGVSFGATGVCQKI